MVGTTRQRRTLLTLSLLCPVFSIFSPNLSLLFGGLACFHTFLLPANSLQLPAAQLQCVRQSQPFHQLPACSPANPPTCLPTNIELMGTPTARGPRISPNLLIGLISGQFRRARRTQLFLVLAKATVPGLPALPLPCQRFDHPPIMEFARLPGLRCSIWSKMEGGCGWKPRMTHPDGEPASSIPGRAPVTGRVAQSVRLRDRGAKHGCGGFFPRPKLLIPFPLSSCHFVDLSHARFPRDKSNNRRAETLDNDIFAPFKYYDKTETK